MSALAYPLQWPAEMPRARSRRAAPVRVSMARAVADLRDSLRLFEEETGRPVRDVVISSNVTLGAARPADPGVALWFAWDGLRVALAVDRFGRPEDNLRAIFQIVEARRREARYCGLAVVRAAFAGLRALPAMADWRAVLGVGADADLAEVDAAYRRRAREAHPDRTGSDAARMIALTAAREAARRELAD